MFQQEHFAPRLAHESSNNVFVRKQGFNVLFETGLVPQYTLNIIWHTVCIWEGDILVSTARRCFAFVLYNRSKKSKFVFTFRFMIKKWWEDAHDHYIYLGSYTRVSSLGKMRERNLYLSSVPGLMSTTRYSKGREVALS